MKIEHRSAGFVEIKLAPDSETDTKGVFSGYGAVFGNRDAYGDVIQKGAFKKTLKEWNAKGRLPPMLLQHGGGMFGGSADDLTPIGKWLEMEETTKGLRVEGKLIALETDRAKYLLEGLKEGVLDGMSIGFRTRQAINGTKPNEPRRTLTDLDLVELSLVTFPANDKALVSSVKSLTNEELRELETALCDKGLSRRQAVTAASVFKAYLLRDAGAELPNSDRDDHGKAHPVTIADVQRTAEEVLARLRG